MDLLGAIQPIDNCQRAKMRIRILAICILLVAGCGTQQQQRNPHARAANNRRAPKRQMISPIGGYVVTSETPNRKSPERDIVITRPGDKREILRFPFQRQVDVVWAPDETGVAVIDLVLQNETRVVIFELPSGRPLFELRREMVCELNPDLPCGDAYTHMFFSNVVWLAPDRIQVNVDMINPLQPGLPREFHGNLIAQFPR
jgi:hypothetical protein